MISVSGKFTRATCSSSMPVMSGRSTSAMRTSTSSFVRISAPAPPDHARSTR